MTTNTTEQEIAEYREQIKLMIEIIGIVHKGKMPTELVWTIITNAHWTLDKYSKNKPSTEIQGELL
tara:strand:- start:258 stop:455 length:198 start_codon:yes stop_codon:yes gene_type:complete